MTTFYKTNQLIIYLFWVCLYPGLGMAGDTSGPSHVNCAMRLVKEGSPAWLRKPRILFVGDLTDIRRHLINNLRAAGMEPEVSWASSELDVATALTNKWSLIVVTRSAQSATPEKVLEMVKTRRRRIPVVIMVDSADQQESMEMAFKAGAVDYVTRYNFQRFAHTVVHELRSAHERRVLRRLQQSRRQAEDDLSLMFNLSRELLFVGTSDGTANTVNPAYLKVLGYTQEEALGFKLLDLIHSEDRGMVKHCLSRLFTDAGGSVFPIEVRMRRKDGVYRRIAWSLNVLRRNVGVVLGVGRDVTEAREREQHERHEDKMRALGQLAAGVAHDFNNLLTIILGYGEFVHAGVPIDDPNYEMTRQIIDAGKRAAELVTRISRFGRKEAYHPKPTMLSASVAEAVNLLKPSYPSSIELITKLDNTESAVMVDGPLLVQVIVNIANNARDAIGKVRETGRIKFSIQEVTLDGSVASVDGLIPAGRYMKLQISDNGSGIDKKIINRLFEHYFTTKQVGEGTGLGLALAHDYIRDHKGWISVASELGVGTSFEIYLPCIPGTSAGTTGKLAVDRPQYRNGRGKRVLLVDDEGSIRQLYRLMLEPENYAVTLAADGAAAFSLFMADPHSFDLVITDLTMPNMTGFQLTEKIRKEGAKVPILLLTGHHESVTKTELLIYGINEMLGKPVQKAQLLPLVERLLIQFEEAD